MMLVSDMQNPAGKGGAMREGLGGNSLHLDSIYAGRRKSCLALLNSDLVLNYRTGSFLGGVAFSDQPMSPKQSKWLAALLEKAGLPALNDGGDGA